ncbi:MAG: ABC transporter substrate-binding protein [Thermodesulfobacteriota bacterium]
MKRIVLVLLTLGMVIMAGSSLAQPKGDLVICQAAEVSAADPARHHSITDINYTLQVFDMLYLRDGQGNPQPRLATSHQIVNDTTWEFKLRTGVKFHHGTVMTAKDVKFSLDRMTDPQTKAFFAPFYSTIKEVKVIDDSTFQVLTKAPDPLLLKRLSLNLFILPSELFKEKGAEAFFQNPVGTGPFKFVSWTRNDRMIFEANEAYWDGAPKVKRVILRPVPEAATRLAELQTGNADIITNIPPFLVPQVKSAPNVDVRSISSGRVMFLYINCLAEGPLKNKKVRQALNYAVDKKSIIDNILKGSGVPMPVNLTPYHFGYDSSLKPYAYDPAMAKKLLAEAGYSSGLKLVFNSPSGRYLLDKEVAQAIAGMFNAVGIQTEMKVHEWGTYTQILTGKKLQDIGFIGWGNTLNDADGNFQPYFTPDSVFSYYSTPALADRINAARTTLDEKKRMEIYKEAQKEVYEEAPLVFLYQQIDHYGVSKNLKDFQVRGDEQFVIHKVSK